MYIQCTSLGDGQRSCKVWLASGQQRRCSRPNEAKTRNQLKFAEVPQTGKPISAVTGPTFAILRGHVEEILLFNSFFSDCRYVPQLRRYSPTNCAMVPRWRIFGNFFASCIFSEPRAARDLHPKFALRPHYVWKYGIHPICDGWDQARKKKKDRRRQKIEKTTGQKYNDIERP